MITNKLSVLMAERKLKATRISSDTGIARSTLSGLTNESSKMIQFETINTLCNYLRITPNDFLLYSPFDIEFDIQPVDVSAFCLPKSDTDDSLDGPIVGINTFKVDIFVKISKNGHSYDTYELNAGLNGDYQPSNEDTSSVELFGLPTINLDISSVGKELISFWTEQSLYAFYSLVENRFRKVFKESAIQFLNESSRSTIFNNATFSIALPITPF
ncbi:helix-turn-helix transcriptional regulator [Levilactobacillus brevis]|uniref:helix-turn-helix domain-containing protein n=1 Tax=Levilactobacillus brevis TaxID=1580 RepID=UPI001C1F1B87|nr:helix-turn-helix transcriptional regulator [Levilactobacillus brevis]MBU7539329.1 helix-turn-helix transcriptional regulator [Levilactobacillus brevis]MBU7565500.1 helix-turn-helix transcriptional regulator [Levilactobacillus brevis]MCE6038120.1 helix-turn-helix transcriptional regulator [Levilactobacillus brevis]